MKTKPQRYIDINHSGFWSPWSGDSFWSPFFFGSSGAEALLQSPSGSLWSGDSFWSPPGSSGALGAETPFGAPLALLERRLFFRAPLAPFGAETRVGAPLTLLERKLFFGAPLALLERRLALGPLWLCRSGGSSLELL